MRPYAEKPAMNEFAPADAIGNMDLGASPRGAHLPFLLPARLEIAIMLSIMDCMAP